MTCSIWLLGYKYFVHFSVWTKCPSDGAENANTRSAHKFLKNFSNDTDVTQQKFISQLVIQDEMWIQHFNSESEQQSVQWNERIGQNCLFITLRNSIFLHVVCKQPTAAKMHKIFTAQKSYWACRVLSLAIIRSKSYFDFILNRTRSGRELFDCPSYVYLCCPHCSELLQLWVFWGPNMAAILHTIFWVTGEKLKYV